LAIYRTSVINQLGNERHTKAHTCRVWQDGETGARVRGMGHAVCSMRQRQDKVE